MHLITTADELASVVSELSKSAFVTVDTEFIRETTFWPELCLIQMAAPGVTALVDPLAPGMNLGPFFDLMANERVTKVFHAARQDIEIIFNRGNLIPHPVFDTQVAAMVCGFGDSVSYEQLVQKLSGGQIDKSSRFTDWRQRPLTDKQLTYALADVTHLIDVYEKLKDEIEKEGRAGWLTEEMEILTARRTYDPHPEDAWKRLKMRMRKPQELAVLQAVATWREFEARERNVPRGRVIKDDAIYEVAQQQPRDAAALARLRTIPKGWERSGQATGLLAAVNTALAIPKDQMPRLPQQNHSPEGSAAAGELLKVLLKLVSDEQNVAAKMLASSDDIERIAAEGEKANVPALQGWRREVFGDKALKLVQGRLALKFDERKVSVFDI
ncbi:ribonuclease D [Aquibium carbonis]|uniref:Ribonuclease D n=1 Tax=Aquibium carbonis TaxID=2495581 RepID=A0A3R9YUH0_9HYPH|nr:ribonuclease D [Aquibium carbonis]RST87387.1 ribonuclease D [Aquibium carbonis]